MKRVKYIYHYKLLVLPLIVLLCSGFFKGDGDVYFKISKSIDIFGKVYRSISTEYVDQIEPEEFMRAGINGMLSALDPYTVFIDEKGKEDINLLTDGKYGGIGVSIGLRNNEVLIVDIMEGYSAQRQGLRIGDVITKIGDTEVNAANFDDISNYVKGEPGTELKLTIKRDDLEEPLQFNLLREEVVIKNLTFYDFIPEGSNNAYLKLTGFSRGAGAEIKKGLEELSAKREIKSIILDLRGNPGGLLDAAVDVAEKFLKKGQLIVSVVGRDTTQISEHFSSEEPAASNNVKLAVLVDEGTASASEIVAGAIQDHDRGVIVGAKTFGKGLVQTIIPLSYNTSLKITTAKYFTPSGRCIQKIDYSDHNDVLLPSKILTTKTYNTDNKRLVYSAGGITPDSLVADDDIFSIDEDLLAKGMYFKFATHYYGKNPSMDYAKIEDEKIFNEFTSFIETSNYKYNSGVSKKLKELAGIMEDEGYDKSLSADLQQFEKKIKEFEHKELGRYKKNITKEIKMELVPRYAGQSARIKESLKDDRQFDTAYNLLNNHKTYSKMLALSK
ncbi:MAG TPA: S41 family peptidase [Ignavibacteriales bacterium]|nr:S41 family peptidase [Ignavibacteriales bacterium]